MFLEFFANVRTSILYHLLSFVIHNRNSWWWWSICRSMRTSTEGEELALDQARTVFGESRSATGTQWVYTLSENADDSSFLFDAGYFRPTTIFEGDSSRGFAAVLVRVCARWPTQHRRRRRRHHHRGTLRRQADRFTESKRENFFVVDLSENIRT